MKGHFTQWVKRWLHGGSLAVGSLAVGSLAVALNSITVYSLLFVLCLLIAFNAIVKLKEFRVSISVWS
jgi:hypothetical protein